MDKCEHKLLNPNLIHCFKCEVSLIHSGVPVFYEPPRRKKPRKEDNWQYTGPQFCLTKHCHCAIKPDAKMLEMIAILKQEKELDIF